MKRATLFVFFSFTLFRSMGQKVNLLKLDQLENRVAKGNDTTYVINFWATWCAPCLKELSHFEKLQAQYKGRLLKVLLISVDFKSKWRSTVQPYVKSRKLKTEVFLLDEKDQQQYMDRIDKSWSGSIPATLFVHKQNRKFLEREFTYSELVKEFQTIN